MNRSLASGQQNGSPPHALLPPPELPPSDEPPPEDEPPPVPDACCEEGRSGTSMATSRTEAVAGASPAGAGASVAGMTPASGLPPPSSRANPIATPSTTAPTAVATTAIVRGESTRPGLRGPSVTTMPPRVRLREAMPVHARSEAPCRASRCARPCRRILGARSVAHGSRLVGQCSRGTRCAPARNRHLRRAGESPVGTGKSASSRLEFAGGRGLLLRRCGATNGIGLSPHDGVEALRCGCERGGEPGGGDKRQGHER